MFDVHPSSVFSAILCDLGGEPFEKSALRGRNALPVKDAREESASSYSLITNNE
jgi:hypothetical protein